MPELRINRNQSEVLNAAYVFSIMKFPRNEKLAQEYCARTRLELLRNICVDDPKEIKNIDPKEWAVFAQDLEAVLNSSYAKGQAKFLEMSEVRTRRGLWAGNVFLKYLIEMLNTEDSSIKLACINAFELIEQGNIIWSPDSKADYGKKTWQEYKPVSHLWCSTLRIFAHIAGLSKDKKPTVQIVIRDNLQYILSLANWMFWEVKSRNKNFFKPHDTWTVPDNYPIVSINEVFALLSVK